MQYLLIALIFIGPTIPFLLYTAYEIISDRAYAKGHDAAWQQAKWAQDTGRRIV